jgi:hypothetical protein
MPLNRRTELVLVEPGAPANAAHSLRPTSEKTHVLLLGADESLSGFDDRVRRRARALRRASQPLRQIVYLVGTPRSDDWFIRHRLLADLCKDLIADGSLAVFARSNARFDVFGCMGELQLSVAAGVQLRAIFSDDPGTAPQRPATTNRKKRSGARFVRPLSKAGQLNATDT